MSERTTVQPCRVLLVNLGGPRSAAEIEKFLIDLLTDPYVVDIPLPEFIRRPMMRRVARKRVAKVAANYEAMGFGGGSPLVEETNKQARALQVELQRRYPEQSWQVDVQMACGLPDIRELKQQQLQFGKENVLLPLFPQFSRSTTLSLYRIIEDISGICPASKPGVVPPFYDQPAYLDAIARLILESLQGQVDSRHFIHPPELRGLQGWQDIDLLFSAHGIPMRLIKKGDQYAKAIEHNVALLESRLRAGGFQGPIHLSYQSKLGRARWTEPSTIQKLQELGARAVRRVAVYPISFVSDHLETLEEIGVELRDVALAAGVEEYHRLPAPGTYPPFIAALADLVVQAREQTKISACQCQQLGGMRPSIGCHANAI